jgi:hypothetical protein
MLSWIKGSSQSPGDPGNGRDRQSEGPNILVR